jgi:tellurite resistance protein TehA-like permease
LIAIVAVVLVMFAAMGAIVIITLVRPGADNLALETEIATITVPTLVGLMAYLKSAQVARQVQEVHISLNSRLSEWMKQNEESKQAAVIAARAEGVVLASGGEKAP